MAASTGPAENNTIAIQTVELGDTFNLWRDVTNTAVYKINNLKVYDFVDSSSITGVVAEGGTLSVSLSDNIDRGLTFLQPVVFNSGVTFNSPVTFNAQTVTLNANVVTIDDYNIILGDTAEASDGKISEAGGGGLLLNRGSGLTAEWLWQNTGVHGITGVWQANSHIGFSGPTSGIYPFNGGSLRVHGSGLQIDGGSTNDHGVLFNLTSTGVAGTTSNRAIEFLRYSPSGSTAFIQVLNGSTYGSQPFVNIPAGANRKVITQAHTFVFGQPLYLNGSVYAAARADAASTAEVVGLVSRVIDSNNFEITFLGEIFGNFSSVNEASSSLTPGSVYYLSPYTAGKITPTQPSAAAQVHKAVLIATSATSGIVYPFTGGVLSSPVNIATATSLGVVFNQLNQFNIGDFVRWSPTATTVSYLGTDAVTYTYNYSNGLYVKAQANNANDAELAGMVIATTDAANSGTSGVNGTFTLLMDGFFSGLSLPGAYGTPANGTVYFLAKDCAGASNALESNTSSLASNYPTAAGSVRKPLLMSTSGNASSWSGYLFSYRGDEQSIQGLSADTRLEDLLVQNLGSCGSVEDLRFGIRTSTGVAGGRQVMRFPYRRPGSVDIGYAGTGTPGASLDVKGIIRAGRSWATQGGDILVSRYPLETTDDSTYPETLNVFGSKFSTGNSVLSYGIRPRSNAADYESTSGVGGLGNQFRAALEVGVTSASNYPGLALYTTAQTNAAVGTAVPINELFTVNTNSMVYSGGNVGIGTVSPQQKFVVSNSGAAGVEIVPSSGIIQSYNRSSVAYSDMILDANALTVRVGTSPAAVLTAQSGGVTFNGTTDFTGTSRVNGLLRATNTTASTSTTTGALTVAGGVGVAGAMNVNGAVSSNTAPTIAANLTRKDYVDSLTRIGATVHISSTSETNGTPLASTVPSGWTVQIVSTKLNVTAPSGTTWTGSWIARGQNGVAVPLHVKNSNAFGADIVGGAARATTYTVGSGAENIVGWVLILTRIS